MGRSFRHYSKYAPVLFVFILALSLTQLLVNGGFLGQGVAEAKVIQEKGVFNEETVAFDKANSQIQVAMAVQDRHTDILMAEPGIVGTATGLNEHGRPAILVFAKSFELAKAAFIPSNIEGVPVVVKITGEIFAMPKPPWAGGPGGPPGGNGGDKVDPTTRFDRPGVPIGVSTGNEGECSSGTIGARVKNGGIVYALSNNHVYALEKVFPNGIGSDVLQPGRFDTDCNTDPNDVIGTLSDFEDIVFSTSANNVIDAAIAEESSPGDLGNATPSDGYGTPKSVIHSAYGDPDVIGDEDEDIANLLGQSVQKYGRTTSLTKGEITGINVRVNVRYSSGIARFVDQIEVVSIKGPFLKPGDSGSLVVTDDPEKNPVGLLFAGNRSGKIGFANRIDAVLTSFSVTIDGE